MTRRGRASRLAVFVSGHGFGHLARTSAVLGALAAIRQVRLTVVTAAPLSVWPRELKPLTEHWLDLACDAGVVQSDDLHVDAIATRQAVSRWEEEAGSARERVLARLAEAGDIDCVVGDVPALAFEVAAAIGVPSIAIANFSWDWIYERMGFSTAAASARSAYAKTTLLLELTPCAPMDAFPKRASLGVLGRRARTNVEAVRRELGLASDERCVLLALRPPLLDTIALPAPEPGLRYLSPGPTLRSRADCIVLPSRSDFLDALAVADAVLSKTGYGIIGDCATNGVPLVWARRQGFPEDAVLAAWLASRPWAREVTLDALVKGDWRPALAAVWSQARRAADERDDVAASAAVEIANLLA